MMTRRLRPVLPTLLSGLVLLGCSQTSPSAATGPAPSGTQITIAEGISQGWAAAYVADAKHYWQAEGLSPHVLTFTSGRLAIDSVLAGKALIGTVAETPVVFSAMEHQPLTVLSEIGVNTPQHYVVARSSIHHARDLIGKPVGYLAGTNLDYFLSAYMTSKHLNRQKLTLVNLNPPEMVTALLNKQIDAFFWGEPYAYTALKQGGASVHLLPFSSSIYRGYALAVANPVLAQQHPSEMVSVMRALAKAEAFIKQHPNQSMKIVSARIKIPVSTLKVFWGDYTYKLGLTPRLFQEMKKEAGWAQRNKFVPSGATLPAPSTWTDVSPLKKADPSAPAAT